MEGVTICVGWVYVVCSMATAGCGLAYIIAVGTYGGDVMDVSFALYGAAMILARCWEGGREREKERETGEKREMFGMLTIASVGRRFSLRVRDPFSPTANGREDRSFWVMIPRIRSTLSPLLSPSVPLLSPF
jgi:hypothetical protein